MDALCDYARFLDLIVSRFFLCCSKSSACLHWRQYFRLPLVSRLTLCAPHRWQVKMNPANRFLAE
jgi:hypothetical protein